MRAQACSWPGWLDSTISTSHLSLVDIHIVAIERHQAIDDDLALQRREDAFLFELQQVTAAAGGDALELVGGKDAQRRLRRIDMSGRERSPARSASQSSARSTL